MSVQHYVHLSVCLYSYLLAISDDQELREYLSQLLDSSNKQNAEFVEELMRRRNSGPALPQNFTVSVQDYNRAEGAVQSFQL